MILARDVTDALDRFSLWAGNLGALLPSTSRLSLDQRLSDAPETGGRICEVLDDLGEAVSDCTLTHQSLLTMIEPAVRHHMC